LRSTIEPRAAGIVTVVTCSRFATLESRPAFSVVSCSVRAPATASSNAKMPSSQPILR
jgi:hypothetical protein